MIKVEYSIQGDQSMERFYMVHSNQHFLKNGLLPNLFKNLVDYGFCVQGQIFDVPLAGLY